MNNDDHIPCVIDSKSNYVFIILKGTLLDGTLELLQRYDSENVYSTLMVTREKPDLNLHYHAILMTKRCDAIRNALTRLGYDGKTKQVAKCRDVSKSYFYIQKQLDYITDKPPIYHDSEKTYEYIRAYWLNNYEDWQARSYRRTKELTFTQKLIMTYSCECSEDEDKFISEDYEVPCVKCIKKHISISYRSMMKGIDAIQFNRAYGAILNEHYHDYFINVYVPNKYNYL